jgi:hypothetical protein
MLRKVCNPIEDVNPQEFASLAQVGRDAPQGGNAGTENSTGGSMGQPKGSMKGPGGAMQNGTMHNGTSGNKVQSGGTNNH